MGETNADVPQALEPTNTAGTGENRSSSRVTSKICLDDLKRCYKERYFVFRTEQVMEYYKAKDFYKVHALALHLLRDEELPILHRARVSSDNRQIS
jgi:hypothetical protein